MTSTVTNFSNLIDETYPIAGINNDTQGFRDNFASIKSAFTATSNEINNLQIQLNNVASSSTVFAQNVADTVTTNVLNSLTNLLSTSTFYTVAAPTTSKGGHGDLKGMVYATTAAVYVCFANWQAPGTTDIWAKVATVGQTW